MPSARRHRSSRSLFSASETRRLGERNGIIPSSDSMAALFSPGAVTKEWAKRKLCPSKYRKNPGHIGLFRQNTFSCARGGGKTRKEPLPRKAASPPQRPPDSKDTGPLQTRIRRQKDLPEQAMRRQAMKGLISLSRSSQESV